MSEAGIQDLRAREAARKSPRPAAWTDHSLAQLTLVRFLEFIREPEALFWVFVFPLLLAAGLGIAFRNRPADVLKIAAVTPQLAQSLRQEKLLDVAELPAAGRRRSVAHRQGGPARRAGPGGTPGAAWCTDTTTPIRKAARRGCWPIAPSSGPPAASIPSLPPTSSCASRDRATSIS